VCHQGDGLGYGPLLDALLRTLQVAEQTGIRAVLLNAMTAEAMKFYQRAGFQDSPLDPMATMITIADIERPWRHRSHPVSSTSLSAKGVRSPSKVQPGAHHYPSRIHEQRGLSKGRTEEVVVRQSFFCRIVQQVEDVDQQLEPSSAAKSERPRHS
jgi:hypothetical protein